VYIYSVGIISNSAIFIKKLKNIPAFAGIDKFIRESISTIWRMLTIEMSCYKLAERIKFTTRFVVITAVVAPCNLFEFSANY